MMAMGAEARRFYNTVSDLRASFEHAGELLLMRRCWQAPGETMPRRASANRASCSTRNDFTPFSDLQFWQPLWAERQ